MTIKKNDRQTSINNLEARLNERLKQHQLMKEANAYYREHKTCKGFIETSDAEAAELDAAAAKNKASTGPYAPNVLHNSTNRINALKKRLYNLQYRLEEVQP